MGPSVIVLIHILIQVELQALQLPVDLLSEGNPIEFIENRLVNSFADPIGLRTLGLRLRMLNLIEFKIELIGMFIQRTRELCSPVRQYPQDLDLLVLKERKNPII